MNTRWLAIMTVLGACSAFAEVAVRDQPQSKDLKRIVVTHWAVKETGPKDNLFRSQTESITLSIEKDAEVVLVVPMSQYASKKENEITAQAWVSRDLLPQVVVCVSGFGASANAEGQFSERYRYVPEKMAFELVKPEPATETK